MSDKIKSIKELKGKIKYIKSLVHEEYEIVYRAFSNKNKKKDMKEEKPSLFYDKKLIDNENEIYHDFIAAKPNEFENMTTFDTLTKMRHYEVPNRLLDVTFDPLLALFFAYGEKESVTLKKIKDLINKKIDETDDKQKIIKLEDKIKEIGNCLDLEEKDFNGSKTICIYVVKKENIKNYDSDTVTVLSILSKLKNKDKVILKTIVDFFKRSKISLGKNARFSFNDCENLRTELITSFPNIELKVDEYIRKKNEFKEQILLLDLCEKIEKGQKNDLLKDILLSRFSSRIIKTNIKKYKNKTINQILEENKTDKEYKNSLSFCLKNINIDSEDISYFDNNFKSRLNLSTNEIESFKKKASISKDSKIFSINELFNFFVSTCVPELNWQLKQEIPGWYENVLDLDTFTQCYLVKPKMNNPRIIAQSGAFFIYPFKDTDIKKSLLKIDDNETVFEITKEIKEELNLLNIKETKYMPDDLTVYAEEIREKYS